MPRVRKDQMRSPAPHHRKTKPSQEASATGSICAAGTACATTIATTTPPPMPTRTMYWLPRSAWVVPVRRWRAWRNSKPAQTTTVTTSRIAETPCAALNSVAAEAITNRESRNALSDGLRVRKVPE